jgi:two-component system, NtrC family, sensor kinase
MKVPRRLSWQVMAGLTFALTSILAFMYVRARAHDASKYFEDVVVLRQLKQLDARWELDALKSRMSIDTNYDSLVDPLADLNQLREKLQTDMVDQHKGDVSAPLSLIESFHHAIEEKTLLVEHFKSHNSVLRNSLAFLPTAADDIAKAIPQAVGGNGTLRKVSADVNQVLLESIVFSQAPSDDAAAEIRLELEHLGASVGSVSAHLHECLGIFSTHVRAVLREQPVVNDLLRSIAAVPTAMRIDAIDALLSREQREADIRAQGYRQQLLIFASALVVLFLYAAIGLVRSHTVINRVNKELQGANATLEERVKERTGQLREAQGELVATARKAGMAQIANNVLHNVGNVLNSVNVSAALITSRMYHSKVTGLAQAVQLLNEHASDIGNFLTRDERGRTLPGYLNKLVATLADEKQSIAAELESLTRSIDHIKEIVAKQHAYSGATSLVASVSVAELLEDALRMNADSVARRRITVVRDFAAVPLLLLDKHLLLQILVNLISNAERAMNGVPDRPHQITLRMGIVTAADDIRLRIRVEDDGEGIAPENLSRLFAHGFTTRKNGHGFGLHSCALAIKEMSGTISAHSDGLGKGAAFTLELPVSPAESV